MRWSGQSVGIIASGPSLTPSNVAYARAHLDRIIAVNESWRMCPSADVLYAADSSWWIHRGPPPDAGEFAGERWTQTSQWPVKRPPWLNAIESKPGRNIAPPGGNFVYTGNNSSFQALGLAVLWGAKFVVFLGLDLQTAVDGSNHWHPDHPAPLVNSYSAYPNFIRAFREAQPALEALGITMLNASPQSALKCYERITIQDACARVKALQCSDCGS